MTRISLRLRLTLTFTLVLALVLAAMGFVVYRQLGRSLMSTVDQNLRRQGAEAESRVKAARPLVDQDAGEGGTLGQLLDSRGRVVRSTPSGLKPLVGTGRLPPAGAARSSSSSTRCRAESVNGACSPFRLRAPAGR